MYKKQIALILFLILSSLILSPNLVAARKNSDTAQDSLNFPHLHLGFYAAREGRRLNTHIGSKVGRAIMQTEADFKLRNINRAPLFYQENKKEGVKVTDNRQYAVVGVERVDSKANESIYYAVGKQLASNLSRSLDIDNENINEIQCEPPPQVVGERWSQTCGNNAYAVYLELNYEESQVDEIADKIVQGVKNYYQPYKQVKQAETEEEAEVGANIKDMSKYTEKEAFLVKDQNWKQALSLVPVTTWTQQEEVDQNCQRGYGTANGVCSYPHLIYHQEQDAFDADSIIYFLQQYSPEGLTIVGESPQQLENLLITDPELGAGLKRDQVQRINLDSYLGYWKSFSKVVYVENDYEKALIASTYASLINAPLIIKSSSLDSDKVFANRKIICVGETGRECDEKYDLEQLQRKYKEKTDSDKVILVNPSDLYEKTGPISLPFNCPNLKTDKSSDCIDDVFTKTSLSAPILAAAKHETIISIDNRNYRVVDDFIDRKMGSLFDLPKLEAGASLDYLLDEKKFEFFSTKDEMINITFSLSSQDLNRDKVKGINLSGLMTPTSSDKKCKLVFKTEKGEKKVKVNPVPNFLGRVPFKILKPESIPADLIPEKDNFKLTIKEVSCGKLFIEKDKPFKLSIGLDNRKIEAEATKVSNKKEIVRSFRGLKAGNGFESQTTVSEHFSYELDTEPSSWPGHKPGPDNYKRVGLETKKERTSSNSIYIKAQNPLDRFIFIKEIKMVPLLKKDLSLTVFASHEAIQLSRSLEWESKIKEWLSFYLRRFRTPVGPKYYSDLYDDGKRDLKIGRITGITPSDVSSYLARDIFYHRLPKSDQALLMHKELKSNYDAEAVKKGVEDLEWIDEFKAQFESVVSCYGYEHPRFGCETYNERMKKAYGSSEVMYYENHANRRGPYEIARTDDLNYLSPSVQMIKACLTCDFNRGDPTDLFCANNIRKGSLGYVGENSLGKRLAYKENIDSIPPPPEIKFLRKVYLEKKSLGTAFNEIDPEYPYNFVLGDPNFRVKR